MPYIKANLSVSADKQSMTAFKSDMGKAIAAFPGKTERWLMVEVQDGRNLWFAGSDEPCAYVEVSLLGSVTDAPSERMTALVTESVSRNFNIPADRVYVKYEDTGHWGWNGSNF